MDDARIRLGALFFDDLDITAAAKRVIQAAKEKRGVYIVTPNAAMAHHAFSDPAFASLLQGAFLSLPDGVGITLGARLLSTPFQNGRVPGVELGLAVAALTAKEGLSLYLLGGKAGVAEKAARELKRAYPALRLAGTADGYFGENEGAVIETIQKSGAALLFCCLGSPLQEAFARRHAKGLAMPILCLGGSLDVYAQKKRRAPRFVRACGCEWLWRTLAEPARFRRFPALLGYLFDLARLKTAQSP